MLLDQAPFGLLTSRTLLRILPEARFIHVLREPTDLVRSLASGVWGPIAIDSATTWAQQYVAAANEAIDLLPVDRVLQVQWEDLQQAWGYPAIVSAVRPGQRAWLPRTPGADREHHTAS